jgi:hypothetical protein
MTQEIGQRNYAPRYFHLSQLPASKLPLFSRHFNTFCCFLLETLFISTNILIYCKSSWFIWFGSRTSGGAVVEPVPDKWLQLEEYVHEELVKDDFHFAYELMTIFYIK